MPVSGIGFAFPSPDTVIFRFLHPSYERYQNYYKHMFLVLSLIENTQNVPEKLV